VNRQVLVSLGSGVLGGLAGAAFVLLVTQKEGAIARDSVAQLRADMQTRLADLDRSLDHLERASDDVSRVADAMVPRARVMPPAPASVEGQAPAPSDDSMRVDGPVFEAAVLDIIERSGDTRDAERAVAREEKQRQRDKYWAEELTMRLGLTPAQTERLLAIQAQLSRDLDHVRGETADGRYVPRENRRAARQAARQRADEQLRAIFTRQQVAAYEALDSKFKIFRLRGDD
jgi:hypothetical protein